MMYFEKRNHGGYYRLKHQYDTPCRLRGQFLPASTEARCDRRNLTRMSTSRKIGQAKDGPRLRSKRALIIANKKKPGLLHPLIMCLAPCRSTTPRSGPLDNTAYERPSLSETNRRRESLRRKGQAQEEGSPKEIQVVDECRKPLTRKSIGVIRVMVHSAAVDTRKGQFHERDFHLRLRSTRPFRELSLIHI